MERRATSDAAREREPSPDTVVLSSAVSGVVSGVVSARDAAALLGVHERTVRRAIGRGELAATKRGRGFAIAPEALDRYRLSRGPSAPEPDPLPPRPLLELVPAPVVPPAPIALPVLEWTRPVGLPAPLTPFIGREREAATIAALLGRDGVRLVTLTGPGGIGKTRLALRVASDLAPRYADGAVLVPLAPVRLADRVLPTVALALGLRDGEDHPPLERLIGFLGDREVLLVLDNFEHVTDAGPSLVDLLVACPGLTILVTSRAPLRVSGERLFAVPPLALPPRPAASGAGGATPDLAEVAAAEAVRLYLDRAQAADAAFALTAANGSAVAEICRRLDGLPLAIELAAAHGAVLSPAALLARLDQQLPLLGGGPRDQPDRLRTMRGAIAWSQDLLDPPQRALLRRLAVFAGSFTVDGAEAVADLAAQPLAQPPTPVAAPTAATRGDAGRPATGATEAAVLDHLAALVGGSLLQRVEQADGESRFGMLETVREFALEHLTAAGEEAAVRRAHAAWCLGFVDRAQAALWAAGQEELLDRIETEHDNLRAALSWAVANDPETALRLAAGLGPFWSKRSHWREGRAWLERALATGAGRESAARATALGRVGAIAGDQGDFEEAERYLDESLALADRIGDAPIAARALRGLGILASNRSDFGRAAALFEQALTGFRDQEDQPGIARCLNDLGLVAERQGDHDRAIVYQEEALPIARRLGDRWQVCVILGNLGGAYYDRGDFARGEALSEEALGLARRLGDTFGVAVNLHNLGNCALRLGDIGGAIERYQETLELTRQLGERHLASRTLDRLGVALHRCGAPRPAARLFGAAAALREATDDTLFADEDVDLTARFRAVRDELGDAVYVAAWESGLSLPFEVAVAEAVAVAGSATPLAPAAPVADVGLTAREVEVLRLLADGRADKEIAAALFMARPTASKHVAAIIAKLGVGSRTAAVAFALRHDLV